MHACSRYLSDGCHLPGPDRVLRPQRQAAAGPPNALAYGIPGRVDLLAQSQGCVERGVKPSDQLESGNREPLLPYSVVVSKPMCRYPA